MPPLIHQRNCSRHETCRREPLIASAVEDFDLRLRCQVSSLKGTEQEVAAEASGSGPSSMSSGSEGSVNPHKSLKSYLHCAIAPLCSSNSAKVHKDYAPICMEVSEIGAVLV
ncbi:hypothetical protein L1987_03854 [Smallanthus sonchifolius]|uniref:Uncharacterized protein n=1 Tax=Smallanthus sonchifolius TaxID=185202 RepID=A0ACB9KBP4_9ASTR|nr:hypothetical protein L1987_03854 [Smallanthus sonchifolius]